MIALTDEIRAQLEAGPLDARALSRVLKRPQRTVLSELESMVEAGIAFVNPQAASEQPQYSLVNCSGHTAEETPSIAARRFIQPSGQIKGYEKSLTSFRDLCMVTRR